MLECRRCVAAAVGFVHRFNSSSEARGQGDVLIRRFDRGSSPASVHWT